MQRTTYPLAATVIVDWLVKFLRHCQPVHAIIHHIAHCRWIKLPHGTELADLMGTKGAKKGGLRKSSRVRVGPTRVVTGVHLDRRPLQLQLQVS